MGSPGARRRLTAAILAVLLAAAACDSPSPPAATPAPSPTPAATPAPNPPPATTPAPSPPPAATPAPSPPPAAPSPTAPATPAPEARSGLDLIEPAPGAWVHRTFEDGEAIEWEHGIFVLDAETGLTEGYAVAGLESQDHYYSEHHGIWIASSDESFRARWGLLLDRETGQSWRWPYRALGLAAASGEHLLFEDLDDRDWTGRFTLANRRMEEVARFSIDARGNDLYPRFSPDGHAVVIVAANIVYLVPVESGQPVVLFKAQQGNESVDFWFDQQGDDSVIVVRDDLDEHYFSRDGAALSGLACPGSLSPDGPTPKPALRSSGCVRRIRGAPGGYRRARGSSSAWTTDTRSRASSRRRI